MRRLLALAALLCFALAPAVAAKDRKAPKAEDLMNPLLSPQYALWLLGPVSRLASKEEIESYLRLGSDEEAKAFVAAFWQRRDPDPNYEGNSLLERFTERLAEANKKFGEASLPGSRTDRGTIYVLYGAPAEERFDIAEHPDDPPVLVWTYPGDAPKGLDGKRPERAYRFIKRGDLTTFFTPNLKPVRPRLEDPP